MFIEVDVRPANLFPAYELSVQQASISVDNRPGLKLKELRERAKMSQSECAALIGRGGRAAFAYWERDSHKRIPVEILDSLVVAFSERGVAPGELMALSGAEHIRSAPPSVNEPESALYDPMVEPDSPLNQAIRALLAGRPHVVSFTVCASALADIGVMAGDLLLVDLSVNRPIPSGTIVCAQVLDGTGTRAEKVFRLYYPPHLVAASPDPSYRRPLTVDDDKVRIVGVVYALFRSVSAVV